ARDRRRAREPVHDEVDGHRHDCGRGVHDPRGGRAGVHASVRGARGPDGQPGHAAGGAGGGPQSGDPGCALPERPALPGPGGGGGAPAGDRPPGGEVDGGHRGLRPGRGPCVPSRGRPRFPTRGHGARPRLGRGWLSAGSEWTCPPRAPPRAPVFGENMESLIVTGAIAVGARALGWLVGWWAERLRLRRAKASAEDEAARIDRKSTRLNSSHVKISYAVFCLKKKKKENNVR